ncbi:MAG: hypothetical protein FJY26_04930 [Betaproteobacteria bacterium]|nr:hypothetical protein [Betaproteobacteria bacterium]
MRIVLLWGCGAQRTGGKAHGRKAPVLHKNDFLSELCARMPGRADGPATNLDMAHRSGGQHTRARAGG